METLRDIIPHLQSLIDAGKGSSAVAIWGSSVEDGDSTASHIADAVDGYIPELEAVGQAVTAVGSPMSQYTPTTPYSTRLRPLSDLERVFAARLTVLRKLEFKAYDTTLAGSASQNADALTAIYDSIASKNDLYAQSAIWNGEIGGWQPNWFRPSFRVNGRDLFEGLTRGAFGANRGDQSIGLPLPYCREDYFGLGQVQEIVVNAQAAQQIRLAPDPVYQRYFILCTAELLLF